MTRSTKAATSRAAVTEAAIVRIEIEFIATLYDWNDNLKGQYGIHTFEGVFEPRWLNLWSRLRTHQNLAEMIVVRAVVDELEWCDYFWPALSYGAIPSWGVIAAQPEFLWFESESVMDALVHTFVLKYDRATLREPSEIRTLSLRGVSLLSGASRNDELWSETSIHHDAMPLAKKTGCITIALRQIPRISPNPRLTWVKPGSNWEKAFLRLWKAVRSTPEVLTELQISGVLSDIYESWALDDGIFSRIANAFLPPDDLLDEHSEYRQFLPAIQKLSGEDQRLFADFDAGRLSAPFAEPASFVWHMLGSTEVESATLVIR